MGYIFTVFVFSGVISRVFPCFLLIIRSEPCKGGGVGIRVIFSTVERKEAAGWLIIPFSRVAWSQQKVVVIDKVSNSPGSVFSRFRLSGHCQFKVRGAPEVLDNLLDTSSWSTTTCTPVTKPRTAEVCWVIWC